MKFLCPASYDEIQRSARHKSGLALRFPRIVRIRDDERPGEIDTLETAENTYKSIA